MAQPTGVSTERFVVFDEPSGMMVVRTRGIVSVLETLVEAYDFGTSTIEEFNADRAQGYWLKIPEAARYAGCTPANIYLEIGKGKLRARRVGEHLYIWASWFNDWQQARRAA